MRILLLILIFMSIVSGRAADQITVNISLPSNGMLIRANVPIFGSVRVPPTTKIKCWTLEYGLGPNPTQWILIKEGTEAIEKDPNETGEVPWNLNKEPEGNLTNWATGLASYAYGNWRQNLNGIYTLRLAAKTQEGQLSETRRTVLVGEAIIRTAGGTATSADLKCRISVPPYAFGGDIGRVVAIIKQVSTSKKLSGLTGTEDTRPEATAIYNSIPLDSKLLSPIYRLYPNGLDTAPPASIEFDYDFAAIAGLPENFPKSGATIRQYNPTTKTWEALKTEWFGSTAKAPISRFMAPQSYIALMLRETPASLNSVKWNASSSLKGTFTGKTTPFSKVKVTGSKSIAEAEADASGEFSIPFQLSINPSEYSIRTIPVEGNAFSTEIKCKEQPRAFLQVIDPKVTATPRTGKSDYILIVCEDNALKESNAAANRSIYCTIRSASGIESLSTELTESIPGSGMFLAEIKTAELITETGTPLQSPVTIEIGNQKEVVPLADSEPPTISVRSTSHPGLLFCTADGNLPLTSSQAHSRARIEKRDGIWRLSGAGIEPSARVINWPVESFPISEWPLIGFTYRLYEDSPWQLLIRNGINIAAYRFMEDDSAQHDLPAYARSTPLISDGKWHYWQGNLQEGPFKRIDGISFGSWIQTGFKRVDPGFKDTSTQILQVQNIFVGKSYKSRNVEMRWWIEDLSPLKDVTWWVDTEPSSLPPEAPDGFISKSEEKPRVGEGIARITLPGDGRWFFHIQATDALGNKSSISQFPLSVYTTNNNRAIATINPSSPHGNNEPETLVWKQPDGSLKIPLPGFGTSLDSRSLVLKIHGIDYPITQPIWDAGSEILTIDASSFINGAPLGFDGEKLIFRIQAKDLANRSLEIPPITVQFDSNFIWKDTSDGGHINFKHPSDRNWIVTWKELTAPWRKYFPGSANNTLMLMEVIQLNKEIRTTKWLHPIFLQPKDEKTLYLKESFLSPTNSFVTSLRTEALPIFSADGTQIKRAPVGSTGESWITAISGTDNFTEGSVRVTSRRGLNITVQVLSLSDAKKILSDQQQETIRIDAWLPPTTGRLILVAPGNRRVLYGDADDLNWRKAIGNKLELHADKEWRRVSVALVPRGGFIKTNIDSLEGVTWW